MRRGLNSIKNKKILITSSEFLKAGGSTSSKLLIFRKTTPKRGSDRNGRSDPIRKRDLDKFSHIRACK